MVGFIFLLRSALPSVTFGTKGMGDEAKTVSNCFCLYHKYFYIRLKNKNIYVIIILYIIVPKSTFSSLPIYYLSVDIRLMVISVNGV